MQFLQPALLAGAALFVVPLVIHLLNRQRHKRRPWAAMEFLLRAYQKQRSRLRNENLLLLLLRCLVPILLALAIARPLLDAASNLLGGNGVVHHVVVLDASYSMGVRPDGGQSPFERARSLIGALLDGFERATDRTDKVTFVLAGVRPRFLCRGDLSLDAVRNQWLLAQRPEDGAGDLGEALHQVAEALDEAKDPLTRVYLFTDLQARSLGQQLAKGGGAVAQAPTGPELHDTVRDHLAQLQQRAATELFCIDTGPFGATAQGGTLDNVQLTGLDLDQPAAVQRTAVTFVARLHNRGVAAADCQVTLDVDGSEPMRKVVTVPAGAEGEAEFQVVFREPGRRRVRAALQNDDLAADDEWFRSVEVRDRIRVLLVDGAAGGDPLKSYAYCWRGRLDPDPTSLPTFAVTAVDALALLGGQLSLLDHDVIVLADVDRLNASAAKALLDALRAGRGVVVAYGPETDAVSYNLHLHTGGEGPQPFRLQEPRGGEPGGSVLRTPVLLLPEHPLFAEFDEEIYREVLQAIPVWRWFGVAPGSLADDAAVLARLTDAEQSPLLVARDFGEGRFVALTSPVASEFEAGRWNRLDDPMVSFPLLHGLVQWLALPAIDNFHVPVGGALSCSLPARPENIELQRPERDGRPKAPVGDEPRALPAGRYQLPIVTDTIYAGFYGFDCVLDRQAGKEPVSLPFAVNVDAEDGDLRYLSHADARAAGVERVSDKLPTVATAGEDAQGNELGPLFLWLTLLFVLGEGALARFVSVRRS